MQAGAAEGIPTITREKNEKAKDRNTEGMPYLIIITP